ncbi:transposase [Vibrio chagasii]|nr:transposase [Vibrio chagasii]
MLLKNRGNLNTQQDSYLTEILNINKDLMTTTSSSTTHKELWYCESEVHAKGLWDTWWAQVQESGIKPQKSSVLKIRVLIFTAFFASASYPLKHLHIEALINKQDEANQANGDKVSRYRLLS